MRILIVKLSSIGDVVHTLPSAAALRRALPEAHISWAVERRSSAVLKGSPAIDELIELDTRAWRKRPMTGETIKEVRELFDRLGGRRANSRIDMAIDFQGLIKSGVVAFVSGAKRRIGFETGELREKVSRLFLTEQVETAAIKHVIEKNLALARAAEAGVRGAGEQGVGTPTAVPGAGERFVQTEGRGSLKTISSATAVKDEKRSEASDSSFILHPSSFILSESLHTSNTPAYEFPILISPEDERYIDSALARYGDRVAIINPGGGWPTKLWSAAAYGEVADWLWSECRLISLITYGPGEESLADAVAEGSRLKTAHPFASTIKQFVALARRAKLFVGGDTGPLHLAAACGTPIVGLYGPTSPERNGPFDRRDVTVGRSLWCRPDCYRRECWHWECMDISMSAVARAISARLELAPIK